MALSLRGNYPHTLQSLRVEWNAFTAQVGGNEARNRLDDAIVKQGAPLSLGIGLTSRCNFDCPMCYYHTPTGSGSQLEKEIPLEGVRRILRAVGPLEQIVFATEGEPFMHSRIFGVLDMASETSKGITIATNGSLISNGIVRRLKGYPINALFLSIDGSDAITYARFRRGGDFHSFLHNAHLLVEEFGARVIPHAVICAQNLDSLIKLPNLAQELGISHISLAQVRMHPFARENGITPCPPDFLRIFLGKLLYRAEKYGIYLVFDEHFADAPTMLWLKSHPSRRCELQQPTSYGCAAIWRHATITTDEKLFPCCGDFQPAPFVEGLSFDGVFNHEYYRLLRAMTISGYFPSACTACRHEAPPGG